MNGMVAPLARAAEQQTEGGRCWCFTATGRELVKRPEWQILERWVMGLPETERLLRTGYEKRPAILCVLFNCELDGPAPVGEATRN